MATGYRAVKINKSLRPVFLQIAIIESGERAWQTGRMDIRKRWGLKMTISSNQNIFILSKKRRGNIEKRENGAGEIATPQENKM